MYSFPLCRNQMLVCGPNPEAQVVVGRLTEMLPCGARLQATQGWGLGFRV